VKVEVRGEVGRLQVWTTPGRENRDEERRRLRARAHTRYGPRATDVMKPAREAARGTRRHRPGHWVVTLGAVAARVVLK